MEINKIENVMEQYVQNGDMLGAVLYIHKNGNPIYQNSWGYADLNHSSPINCEKHIFRMASLSKVVTAVGIMMLIEEGKLGLDDKVCTYLPEFSNMRVVDDARFAGMESLIRYAVQKEPAPLEDVKTIPAERDLTVRDLLTHSSGMEMGTFGLLYRQATAKPEDNLEIRVRRFAQAPLDFQPGTGTGYSATGAFDTLARMIEVISGRPFAEYLSDKLFEPLKMKHAAFHLTEKEEKYLVPLYCQKDGVQMDASGSEADLGTIINNGPNLSSGSGGLLCAPEDFDRFTRMLANGGSLEGVQILKPETVKLMYTQTAYRHLEPEPGMEWGLGVKIRRDPRKAGSFVTEGGWGWSGAYGTHMVVSPADGLSFFLCMNRADIGGSGSYISAKMEELVFDGAENFKERAKC